MRLDFNVLWVEDQPDPVRPQVTRVARHMRSEGFDLQATFCRNMEEVRGRLTDDVFVDEIDLILVDWDLGNNESGDEAIREIRDPIPYKDIVFYSAKIEIENLRKVAFGQGAQGVYFTHRKDPVEEVNGVFDSLIKKVLDIDHTRGIVMGATSDIDQMARECLQLAHDLLEGAQQDGILAEMVELLDSKAPDLDKRVGKLKESATVQSILTEHRIFTANDSLRILSRLLDKDVLGGYVEHQPMVLRYIKEVVPERNILGHQVLSAEGKPVAVAAADGKVVSLEEMRELRRTLLELRSEFRTLYGSLSSRDD